MRPDHIDLQRVAVGLTKYLRRWMFQDLRDLILGQVVYEDVGAIVLAHSESAGGADERRDLGPRS